MYMALRMEISAGLPLPISLILTLNSEKPNIFNNISILLLIK